jgi:hypothetical protein
MTTERNRRISSTQKSRKHTSASDKNGSNPIHELSVGIIFESERRSCWRSTDELCPVLFALTALLFALQPSTLSAGSWADEPNVSVDTAQKMFANEFVA